MTLAKSKSFTLIEIIIALTILGAGLISVMAYLPIALDASKRASDLTKASLIAQGLIEEMKAESYNDITAVDVYDTGEYDSHSGYVGFEYKIDVNPKGVFQSKDITVTVRWNFRGKLVDEVFETKLVKYNPT